MNNIDFNDYRNLIGSLANRISAETGIDADELFSEGTVAFAHIVPEYDESMNVCFSTFLTIAAMNRMKGFVRDQNRKPLGDALPLDLVDESPSQCRTARFKAMLAALGDEAREVVDIVLGAPGELLGEICSSADGDDFASRLARRRWNGKGAIRGALRKYLTGQGWSRDRISSAYGEIETALMEV